MKNRVCELLKIEKPVMLAAMIYICEAQLAAAVCNAGGLGMLGMNCGVDTPERDPVKNGENMRKQVRKLRTLTDKPFAVNYIPPFPGTDPALNFALPYKKIIIEEKVPVVLMIGNMEDGNIEDEIRDFKDAGVTVVYREVSCTLIACIRAAMAGADAIVVTGCDAGGHVSKYAMSLISILPQVTDAITGIPVIASGGIINAKGARAAAAMGAEGVYCGTAFMVAKEGRLHENYVNTLLKTTGEEIIVWKGSTARMSTTNNYVGRICRALDRGGASAWDIGSQYGGTFEASMLKGDTDRGCVTVNSAIGAITESRPAKAILDDIAKGFK
ncbi:MAG: nitronate monooxygenase [Oscillospiraceae bacterium]|jgi:enoyl-[acyl-carrier protein] reductase II|nr:nitronate monooxygenase [Oscillospiraceae bacterium]